MNVTESTIRSFKTGQTTIEGFSRLNLHFAAIKDGKDANAFQLTLSIRKLGTASVSLDSHGVVGGKLGFVKAKAGLKGAAVVYVNIENLEELPHNLAIFTGLFALDRFIYDSIKSLKSPMCFSSDTAVLTPTGKRKTSEINVGDIVLAFDQKTTTDCLIPAKVVRIFRNTTAEWLRLKWGKQSHNGVSIQEELFTTPGHHFLNQFGEFQPIEEMIDNGEATVILANGEETRVKAERIVYSAETAHLFEQAQSVASSVGNLAVQPEPVEGWKTYNFEVEELHTYIAGGVRVHNMSIDRVTQTGDTLSEIALRYGTSVAALLRENPHIKDPNMIYAGKSLHITPGLVRGTSNPTGNYQVRPGDTLSDIAQRARTTVAALLRDNRHITDPNKIYAGSRLQITLGGKVQSSSASGGPTVSFSTAPGIGGPYAGQSWRDTPTGGTRVFDPSSRQYKDVRGSNAGNRSTDQSTGSGGGGSSKPVLIDLDGNGLDINTLKSSNFFYDVDGDGQKNRTAWAGAGDGAYASHCIAVSRGIPPRALAAL